MTCTIVGLIVTCLGTLPAPNPDKAFQTFVQSARSIVVVPVYPPAIHYPIPPDTRGASLGPWDFPPPAPRTRLDGSLLTDPVTVYGGYPGVALSIYPPFGYLRPDRYRVPPRAPRPVVANPVVIMGARAGAVSRGKRK